MPGLELCVIPGRVLYVDGKEIWRAIGRNLLKSSDGGHSWKLRARLPVKGLREYCAYSKLGGRLARSGFHHFVKTGEESGIVVAHSHIFKLKPGDKSLHRVAPLHCSRPLALCLAGENIYYGEYWRNPKRDPVYIWTTKAKGNDWKPVWRFDGIRHVHGIFFDEYTSDIWVTTGDEDNETAIWRTSNQFKSLERVAGGAQRYRAVQLLFTEEHIYFGSDAPDERNYIYRLDRSSGRIESLAAVGNPVFFGCKVGDTMFFSTVVEPSDVNRSCYADIWGSTDGENWKIVHSYLKDILSMKYFQYGQIRFPMGPGDNENLWYTPIATRQDQTICKLVVKSLGN